MQYKVLKINIKLTNKDSFIFDIFIKKYILNDYFS